MILLHSWPLSTTILLLTLCFYFLPIFSQCPDNERLSLLTLKQGFQFDKEDALSRLATWNSTVDCCSWAGVTCHGRHVTGLDLSKEWISGGMNDSSSLFKLTNLRSLNLAYNSFTWSSSIIFGFGSLRSLVYLNMSYVGFNKHFPFEISNLTRLAILDLSFCAFELKNPDFRKLTRNLTSLTELYLDGVIISAPENKWGYVLSSSVPNLKVLSLSGCGLSGPIDPSLRNLHSLTVIHLNSNDFEASVPEFFAKLTNLTSLHISDSSLSGTFPEKIFKVHSLQIIDLSNNELLKGSLPNFPLNGGLQVLALHKTSFSGTLPDSIGNLVNLSKIDVGRAKFTGSIPSIIGNLTKLVYLDFSLNGFTGSLPSFSLSKDLTYILLADNFLFGSINSTRWGGLSHLTSLNLENNSLSGCIPSSLFVIPTIQEIRLSRNQFSSFEELDNVSSLMLNTLDLSSNSLGGPLPMYLFKLQGLAYLSVSLNNLTGNLKLDMIQQLGNLISLDLSRSGLSIDDAYTNSNYSSSSFPQMTSFKLASCRLRKIPDFLRNQSLLTDLDLSDNELEGSTPTWIWNLEGLQSLNLSCNSLIGLEGYFEHLSSNLFTLDLHSNQLQGQITLYPLASYLDYSSNNFSSIVAPLTHEKPNTLFLSLAKNKIQGNIPQFICNASTLEVLDLSNNRFSGPIPRCLTDMKSILRVLNLQDNNLNGSIPNTFSVTCALMTLDLSGNDISGIVPKSIANCKKLEILDLGKNQLSGKFPWSLNNIPTLRVIILRSNKFYGKIRCPKTKCIWSSLQILDLAHNNFCGRLLGEWITTLKAMIFNKDEVKRKLNYIDFLDDWGDIYYHEITITNKGLEMKVVKIMTILTSIDLSNNKFEGSIPNEMGQLHALHVLNLSHNTLSGKIPSSLGNLKQLESMDLSSNNFNGRIPIELGTLNFIAVLNLSYNRLVGRIPTSTQFQSFSADSFKGNEGLCGPPLTSGCGDPIKLPPHEEDPSNSTLHTEFEWNFLSFEVGFISGFAIVFPPLLYFKKWRIWYYRHASAILSKIFPRLGSMLLD